MPILVLFFSIPCSMSSNHIVFNCAQINPFHLELSSTPFHSSIPNIFFISVFYMCQNCYFRLSHLPLFNIIQHHTQQPLIIHTTPYLQPHGTKKEEFSSFFANEGKLSGSQVGATILKPQHFLQPRSQPTSNLHDDGQQSISSGADAGPRT